MQDSVIESDEKYYPQTFQKNANMYKKKKKKIENYIDEELDSDSNNDDEKFKIF